MPRGREAGERRDRARAPSSRCRPPRRSQKPQPPPHKAPFSDSGNSSPPAAATATSRRKLLLPLQLKQHADRDLKVRRRPWSPAPWPMLGASEVCRYAMEALSRLCDALSSDPNCLLRPAQIDGGRTWGASSSPWATSSPAATTSPDATVTSSPMDRSPGSCPWGDHGRLGILRMGGTPVVQMFEIKEVISWCLRSARILPPCLRN
ncbi:unnamed protein product [Urochloa humidicola]